MKDLEWRYRRGQWLLCDAVGEVLASVRETHDRLWRAQFAAEPIRTFGECDEAKGAMLDRYDQLQLELAKEKKRQEAEKPKPKENKDAGKNT